MEKKNLKTVNLGFMLEEHYNNYGCSFGWNITVGEGDIYHKFFEDSRDMENFWDGDTEGYWYLTDEEKEEIAREFYEVDDTKVTELYGVNPRWGCGPDADVTIRVIDNVVITIDVSYDDELEDEIEYTEWTEEELYTQELVGTMEEIVRDNM